MTLRKTRNDAANQPGSGGEARRAAAAHDALVRQAEMVISYVLRGGVLVSAAVILIGVVLFYARWFASGARAVNVVTFPHSLSAVGMGLGHGDPLAVIALGLLLLLATPILRVAVSVITFVIERDWIFTGVTLLVLLILVLSFVLARGGA